VHPQNRVSVHLTSSIMRDETNTPVDTTSTASSTSKPAIDSPSSSAQVPSRWLYIFAAALSLIGLGDSIYLLVKHLTGQTVQCTISTGCEEVLGSAYATLFGYPLAAFGVFAYFTAFSLATLAAFGYRHARTSLLIVVGLMTLMTVRLLYLQAFVLEKYCEFCLLSAAITLSLAALMFAILFGSEARILKSKKKPVL
jgi:uncharacterized membrane protein